MGLNRKTVFIGVLSLFAAQSFSRDVIHPGGEENLGYLSVTEPNWGSAEEAHVFPYTLQYRNTTLQAGFKARFTAGEGCLTLSSAAVQSSHQLCGIRIEKRKHLEYTLGGLVVAYGGRESSTLAIDFGPVAQLAVSREGRVFSVANHPAWQGNAKQGLAVLPGRYQFSFGVPVIEATDQVIQAGRLYRLDLTPADRRSRVVVRAPERAYPNPTPNRCESPRRNFLLIRNHANKQAVNEPHPLDAKSGSLSGYGAELGVTAFRGLALEQDETIRVFPFTKGQKPLHYEYVVNNLAQSLELVPGKTTEITVRRIDVDDVLVKKENGEEEYVKGNYRIFRKNLETSQWDLVQTVGGQYSDCSGRATLGRADFPTKSGLDVLPGTYKVVVSYSTAEGAKVQEYQLDLKE